jgi:hypothetical protein
MSIDVPAQLQILQTACEALRGPQYCTPTVVQAMAAIVRHETGFGDYKPFARPATSTEPAWQSFNYGAMQCGARPDKNGNCPEGCFRAGDSSPVTGAYQACFQVHPSAEAGAAAFAKLVLVSRPGIAAALPSGDAQLIAEAMHRARYYEGFGATVEIRIRGYAEAIFRNAQHNAKAAKIDLLITLPPPPAPSASAAPSAAPSASAGAPADAPAAPVSPSDGALALGFVVLLAAFVRRLTRALSAPTDP